MKGIALQLYTMRDPARADLLGTLKRVRQIGWEYVPRSRLPRSESDVLVEPYLREALIRLNPEIAARPDRAV